MHALLPPREEAARLLQEYLEHSIPLVPQMQIRVVELNDAHLVLGAPLAPNRNHIGTVFGGSLNGLATLSCWGLVWLLLHGRGAQIVIREGNMKFRRPATSEFTAHCPLPPQDVQRQFVEQFQRRGRAGLDLEAEVHCNGSRVAEFQGNFVAIRSAKAET